MPKELLVHRCLLCERCLVREAMGRGCFACGRARHCLPWSGHGCRTSSAAWVVAPAARCGGSLAALPPQASIGRARARDQRSESPP
jgi:hypothetical protein